MQSRLTYFDWNQSNQEYFWQVSENSFDWLLRASKNIITVWIQQFEGLARYEDINNSFCSCFLVSTNKQVLDERSNFKSEKVWTYVVHNVQNVPPNENKQIRNEWIFKHLCLIPMKCIFLNNFMNEIHVTLNIWFLYFSIKTNWFILFNLLLYQIS
jgi:hypothetical protein